LAEGLAADTPVVIMTAVSRPEEEVETLTLRDLAARGTIAHEQPVLIGVGRVFAAVAARRQGQAPQFSSEESVARRALGA